MNRIAAGWGMAALFAAFAALGDAGHDAGNGNAGPRTGPWSGYGPAGPPPLYPVNPPRPAVHAGARGYVHNPVWRHPAHVQGQRHFRFQFHGHRYIVLAGPIFAAPWLYYPYVSTPDYPASFYVPDEPGYFLYYCPSPAGYYPDVVDCPAGWWSAAPDDSPGY